MCGTPRKTTTRTTLALRLYERERGRLPNTLDELVDAKLLSAVPTDPFGKGALGYSAMRRVLWSVGADGKGDGVRDRPKEVVEDIPEEINDLIAKHDDNELIWNLPPLAP